MMKLAQLQAIHGGLQSDVATLQANLDRLNAEIFRIKSDNSRHDSYIAEKVDDAKKAALPAMGERLGTFGFRLETAKAQRKFWESTPMVLAQQTFDNDPVKDAAIRQSKGFEFAAMDSSLLQLVADSAKEDANLPLLFQAYIAGFARHGQPGWRGIDLSDVVIPEQAAALQIIRQCEGLAMQASDILAQASGGGLTPVRKLQTARALAQG